MTDPKTETQATPDESAPDYPPVTIGVWFSLDAEPEVRFAGIAPWLVVQTLYRAADNLSASEEDVVEDDEEGEEV